jgi:hypothetical protein
VYEVPTWICSLLGSLRGANERISTLTWEVSANAARKFCYQKQLNLKLSEPCLGSDRTSEQNKDPVWLVGSFKN